MKIAAQAQLRPLANSALKLDQQSREIFPVIEISVIRVRGCDHVLDAVGGGNAAHGFGDVPGFGAVVHFRQNVAVNINHCADLSRFRGKTQSSPGCSRRSLQNENKSESEFLCVLCVSSAHSA